MALNDTICALSTPPGTGAIAMLRLSGPEAVAIAMMLAPKLEGTLEARHAYFVELADDEGPVDEGVLTIFIGLLMMDLPKKRALERKLLRNEKLRKFINTIRTKFHRPPLQLPQT